MTVTIAVQESGTLATGNSAIRPFQKVTVPETELTELRRRINNTKWPERETVTDATQGVQLATTQLRRALTYITFRFVRCPQSRDPCSLKLGCVLPCFGQAFWALGGR